MIYLCPHQFRVLAPLLREVAEGMRRSFHCAWLRPFKSVRHDADARALIIEAASICHWSSASVIDIAASATSPE